MADIILLNSHQTDYEIAVEEIDFLVPKYLSLVEELGSEMDIHNIGVLIANIVKYWNRLSTLLLQISNLEREMNIRDTMNTALQNELSTLEKVYLYLQEHTNDSSREDVEILNITLMRMDTVLEGVGFQDSHRDRQLIQTLINHNMSKQERLRRTL